MKNYTVMTQREAFRRYLGLGRGGGPKGRRARGCHENFPATHRFALMNFEDAAFTSRTKSESEESGRNLPSCNAKASSIVS